MKKRTVWMAAALMAASAIMSLNVSAQESAIRVGSLKGKPYI